MIRLLNNPKNILKNNFLQRFQNFLFKQIIMMIARWPRSILKDESPLEHLTPTSSFDKNVTHTIDVIPTLGRKKHFPDVKSKQTYRILHV